jgi:hypothetical protein
VVVIANHSDEQHGVVLKSEQTVLFSISDVLAYYDDFVGQQLLSVRLSEQD